MRQLLFAICIFTFLSNCSHDSNRRNKLSDFIPNNSAFIIKTESVETLESDLKNNDFIAELASTKLINSLKKEFKKFDSLNINEEAIICISDDNNFSLITKLSEEIFLNDSLKKTTEEFYKTTVDSILIASTSKEIIDEITIQKKYNKPDFERLFNSSNPENSFSLFINSNITKPVMDSIFNCEAYSFDKFSDWVAIDFDLQQDIILGNGVAIVTDTIPKLIDIFKNTIPQENKTHLFAPSNCDGFISLTFDDFDIFYHNLNKYNSTISENTSNLDLFNSINEIGLIYSKDNTALVLQSTDIIETKDALLSEQNVANNFREINIYNFGKKELFKSILTPFVSNGFNKYIVLNEAIIFGDSEELLINIITDKQNKKSLDNSEVYQDNISYLSDESSMLFVANNENFKSVLANYSSEKFKKEIENLNLKSYQFSALQFVRDNDFAHVNTIIKKNKSKVNKNSISQEFNIVLDDDILNTPQIVKNHRNNQKEIIVQDIKNNLYLISNRGKVLWKKKLNGNILGEVEQIDIYKNGRLQLAFATPKRVYILDRNGKEVKPFSLKFNDEITQPLSVFDYDNKKNYRFFVVQGKETLMMDTKGKTVKGFKFKKANSKIVTQPKHFRIGTKDYIVFASGKKLNILDRTGKTRINVNKDFNFSDNDIYLYKGYFCFTNINGQLVQVDQKGRVNIQNLVLPRDHSLATTSKTLVTLADNTLVIKGKKVELEFGNYTEPSIFYLRDKIYIALTELQSGKVYLFDSQAKLIQNFPVYGNSTLQLDNLDRDRNLEFVVKGDNKSIILYQLN